MFEGLSVALVTPFKDGALDEAAIERLVDFVVGGGTDVLVVAGSTGEAVTLTREERRRLYQAVQRANKGRARLVAGTGTNVTARLDRAHGRGARTLGLRRRDAGVPYYNKPTPAGQVAHFSAIARRGTTLPLILYNVPGRTGTNMLPETRRARCRGAEHRRGQGGLGLARPGERDPRPHRPHDPARATIR